MTHHRTDGCGRTAVRACRAALVASTTAFMCVPAYGPATAQQSTGADAGGLMEELIVTARKREESLFDTPTSLSVFGDTALKRLNVSNLDDVGKYVPNLNVNRFGVGNPSQAAIFIRGIGLQDHLIVTDPGVGVYLDGVYLGRQMGANLTLQNIERIEVLRGPQGTLYGRNSIGGAINIITQKPGAEEEVFIDIRGGTRERAEFSAYGNFRLTDTLAVSINGGFKRREGVGDAVNLDNPEERIGQEMEINGRIAALWEPTDTVTVEFSIDGLEGDNGQSPYAIEILTPEQLTDITGSPLPAGVEFFDTPLLTEADLVDRDDLATNIPGLESTSNSSFGASLTLTWDATENITAKLLTSYRQMEYTGGLDDDDTIFNLSEFPERGEAEQISIELQVNAVFGDWDIVGGLYYFYEDGSNFSGPFSFVPFNGAIAPDGSTIPGTLENGDFFNQEQETNSYAAYVNASYTVNDRLTVGAGVRYTRDEKDANALFPSFGGVTDFESANFEAITADANATYAINDRMSVYAQIQRGYQTGGFPPRPFGGPQDFEPFDEQTALNYEVGFKGAVADFWTILFAAFWTQYDDLALSISVPQAGGFVTFVENAGESRSRGIEIESQMAFANGFFFNGSLGYLDSEITQVNLPEPGSTSAIVEGDEPNLTPTVTATATIGYRHELADGDALSFQADYSFRGDMFGQPVNLDVEVLEDRSLVGFSAQYESQDGSWTFGIYGENIFNEVYDQGRLINTFHGFVGIVLSNDRSEFGARFTKRFGGF